MENTIPSQVLATTTRRIFANFIDSTLELIYFFSTSIIYYNIFHDIVIDRNLENFNGLFLAIFIFVGQLLFTFTSYKFLRNSIGKYILKIQARNNNGVEFTYLKFLARYFLKYISLLVSFSSIAFIYTNNANLTLYDYILKSNVFENKSSKKVENAPASQVSKLEFNTLYLTLYILFYSIAIIAFIWSNISKFI